MKKKFTIKDIDKFLEDEFNLIWVFQLVYDAKNDVYKSASINDFETKQMIAVLGKSNHAQMHAKLSVSSEKFEIQVWNKEPIDKSEQWQEMLANKEQTKQL